MYAPIRGIERSTSTSVDFVSSSPRRGIVRRLIRSTGRLGYGVWWTWSVGSALARSSDPDNSTSHGCTRAAIAIWSTVARRARVPSALKPRRNLWRLP